MNKKIIVLSTITLLIILVGFFFMRVERESGDHKKSLGYVYMGRCALWSANFEIIYHFPGSYCELVEGRGMAVRKGDGILFVGQKNEIIFEKNDQVYHHGLYYDNKRKLIFAITAEDYQNEDGTYSVVSGINGFDLEGGLKFELRPEAVLKYFEQNKIAHPPHDRKIEIAVNIGIDWMLAANLKSQNYLTLANNIHIIKHDVPNTLFKAGDVMFNILFPSGFLLLDGQTAEIKGWYPYYTNELVGEETHHPMIVGDELLVFLNRVASENKEKTHAKVVSKNLETGKINWLWPKDGELEIYSPTHGGIYHIKDQYYLVYTMHDNFILVLDAKTFQYRYLLKPDDTRLEGLRDGRQLVDLKVLAVESFKGFEFLKLDLYYSDLLSPTFYKELF